MILWGCKLVVLTVSATKVKEAGETAGKKHLSCLLRVVLADESGKCQLSDTIGKITFRQGQVLTNGVTNWGLINFTV